MDLLSLILHYNSLGYTIEFSKSVSMLSIDVKMTKDGLGCTQTVKEDHLTVPYLNSVFNFMFGKISK